MRYYDPEYNKEITEKAIKRQYEWFNKHSCFRESYDQFKKDNFKEVNTEEELEKLMWEA